MASRGLKICLAVSALFFIIVTTVIVALALTIFKPKDPDTSVHPFGLEKIFSAFSPNSTLNVPLGMVITIVNPNYGSFNYINSTGYVNYYGTVVAEVPIETKFVPARSKINMTTYADFMVGKLIKNPNFVSDIVAGTFNMTSTAALPGKVGILKIIKLKATVYSSCDITINISSMHADTKCISKIKF